MKKFLMPFLLTSLMSYSACYGCFNLNKSFFISDYSVRQKTISKSNSNNSQIFSYDSPLSSLDNKIVDNFSSPTTLSSKDENYILKNIDYSNMLDINATYTSANCFMRKPIYKNVQYYKNIQVGDIIIETKCQNFWLTDLVNNPGHVALIIEKNANSAYGNYIKTIEVVGGGVQYGFLDDDRFINFGVEIYRPCFSNNDKIETAINFAKSQLGKPYSFDATRTQTSSNSSHRYCSELVYAAYSQASIKVGNINKSGSVMPYDILYCHNVYIVPFYYFVDIRIDRYYGNKDGYYFEVFNATDERISLQYNSKMCYFKDAAYWTNLKDVKTIQMNPNSSTNVAISSNRFADAFAFSIMRNNKRLITTGSEVRQGSYYMATFKIEREV